MKYGIFRNILLFSFIIALPSCYQDLGNYEYKEINEIVITPGKYSFMPPAPGMTATVTIDPERRDRQPLIRMASPGDRGIMGNSLQ